MKNIILTVLFFAISCTSENLNNTNQNEKKESVYICHNPNSQNHRKICTEQCFVPNLDEYSFCWELKLSDCESPLLYEWQHENCHFFD